MSLSDQTTVLFVDDDINVLSGLRRMLHSYRDRWAMQFAVGGEEAIGRMKQTVFDVVISDMKMPLMDGAEVLIAATRYAPSALRVVLSGQSDREQTYRVLETAHQFISKPCDVKVIETIINKAQNLKSRLPKNELRAVATSIRDLPVIEKNLCALRDQLRSHTASLENVISIVASDIALTARILQLVNSSFFGQPTRVVCPVQATKLLGLEIITELTVRRNLFRPFREREIDGKSLHELTEHSLEVARCAKEIASCETGDEKVAQDAYLAGMLHDVGKLVLADQIPELDILGLGFETDRESQTWPRESHISAWGQAELGSYVLALWGLPESIVDAVASYQQPHPSSDTHSFVGQAVRLAHEQVDRSYRDVNGTPASESLCKTEG